MWPRIRQWIMQSGAVACGASVAAEVDAEDRDQYMRLLAEGAFDGMDYLKRNIDIRFDPRQLLQGCRTVVSIAFPYNSPRLREETLPYVARFAYGRDYHNTIRSLLRPVCRRMEQEYGARTRICVDSAPIRERYWAFRAGIALRGLNGMAIVPQWGSWVILAEILTTLDLPTRQGRGEVCSQCGECLKACPQQALKGRGEVEACRCLAFSTIESREMSPVANGEHLFGCDSCQTVCPHNSGAPSTPIRDFHPTEQLLTLDAERLGAMTQKEFDDTFRGTSLRRAGLQKLRANIRRR